MTISLCIVAYNEESSLKALFDSIRSQTYPKNKTELVLIDNGSNDSTLDLMQKFKDENSDSGYMGIQVISIPRHNLAYACNIALENFKADVYVRVDAHATIAEDFLEKNIECFKSGEDICGGHRPCVVAEDTPMQHTLLATEESMFGSSFASYRRECSERTYTSSLFHLAMRRSVYEKAGKYNDTLGRTEDNEYTYRLRTLGYKLCYDPDIHSYQHVRSSLKKMIKQKYSNGYWIGKTLHVCPKCFSIFHFAPLALVLGLIGCLIIALLGFKWLLWLLISAYLLFDIAVTVSAFATAKKIYPQFLLLPFIFPVLHLCYGVGTLIGIFSFRK